MIQRVGLWGFSRYIRSWMSEVGVITISFGRHHRAFITHKQVQKARKGRWLTANMQRKIEQAVNACAAPDSYALEELFTYRGKRKL